MRANAARLLGLPVQCAVAVSVSRSAMDQTLKYGSCATSGTAGGRSGWAAMHGARRRKAKRVMSAAYSSLRRGCLEGCAIRYNGLVGNHSLRVPAVGFVVLRFEDRTLDAHPDHARFRLNSLRMVPVERDRLPELPGRFGSS